MSLSARERDHVEQLASTVKGLEASSPGQKAGAGFTLSEEGIDRLVAALEQSAARMQRGTPPTECPSSAG